MTERNRLDNNNTGRPHPDPREERDIQRLREQSHLIQALREPVEQEAARVLLRTLVKLVAREHPEAVTVQIVAEQEGAAVYAGYGGAEMLVLDFMHEVEGIAEQLVQMPRQHVTRFVGADAASDGRIVVPVDLTLAATQARPSTTRALADYAQQLTQFATQDRDRAMVNALIDEHARAVALGGTETTHDGVAYIEVDCLLDADGATVNRLPDDQCILIQHSMGDMEGVSEQGELRFVIPRQP